MILQMLVICKGKAESERTVERKFSVNIDFNLTKKRYNVCQLSTIVSEMLYKGCGSK